MSISTPRCDDQDNISLRRKLSGADRLIRLIGRGPAVFLLFFLGCGMVVGASFSWASSAYALLVVVVSASGTIAALLLKTPAGILLSVSTTVFVAGMFLSAHESQNGIDFEPPIGVMTIEAEVRNTLASGKDFKTLLLARGNFGPQRTQLPGYGRVVIRQADISAGTGDRIAFRGRLRKPINSGNPGEFDWELDCKNNGILWLASVHSKSSVVIVSRGALYRPAALVFRIREEMSDFFERQSGAFIPENYSEDVMAILKGIVVGDTGDVSPQLYKTFSDSGLVHALSASGVHIAIVAFLAICIAKVTILVYPGLLLWVPSKKFSAMIAIPSMIFYCLIVGARVPAIRATIMGVMIALSFLWERKWDSYNSLACAAVMVLLIYPLSIFTPSFQLSFLAMAGIVMVARSRAHVGDPQPAAGRSNSFVDGKGFRARLQSSGLWAIGSLKDALLVSLGAVLAITPLIWYLFHGFPVYTLFANLVTDTVMTGALGLGLLAGLVNLINPWAASLILIPAECCAYYVVRSAAFFAGLPGSVLRRAHPDFFQIAMISVFVVSLLGILRRPPRKHRNALLAVLFVSASVLIAADRWRPHQDDLEIYFLNVGKGDAIFIRPPGAKGLMVDGGVSTEHFDAGRSIVVPFFHWAGVSALDGIVLTHPDMDHMGGLLSVLDVVHAQTLLWNPIDSGGQFLHQVMKKAREKAAELRAVSRESPPLTFGAAVMTFLNLPVDKLQSDDQALKTNDASVVFRVDYRASSFLFTGDLEEAGEEELVQSGLNLRADLLKVGHHGSKSSSSAQFLDAVRPKMAVVSADSKNFGGLPHNTVLGRLEERGVRVFWTGRDGAVTVNSDGKSFRVRVGRTGEVACVSPAGVN